MAFKSASLGGGDNFIDEFGSFPEILYFENRIESFIAYMPISCMKIG
jgi:hypothetical protein